MKIVSKKYLIYGYYNPMPFIDLPKIFSENNINFLKSDLFGKCSLRIYNNALRSMPLFVNQKHVMIAFGDVQIKKQIKKRKRLLSI